MIEASATIAFYHFAVPTDGRAGFSPPQSAGFRQTHTIAAISGHFVIDRDNNVGFRRFERMSGR